MDFAGNILGMDNVACITHDLQLVDSRLGTKEENQQAPAGKAVVSGEIGVGIYKNDEDDELSKNDRLQMGHLRDAAVEEMDDFLNTALENLGVGEMATMRGIVQNFWSLAVYFRTSPKARDLDTIQKTEFGISPDMFLEYADAPHLSAVCTKCFLYASGIIEFKGMQNKL
ncbi:hypothetical protein V7S43_008936 [Phytophthora oleae]|uniref:Uncharacterized protein n=1 Tax=Phytophthora oleae TaxID=2107226 RepID=A0ABD3FIC4_9STRA